MKLEELKALARERGLVVRAGRMPKEELIHLLQEKEGSELCFGAGKAATCGQDGCCWREECT